MASLAPLRRSASTASTKESPKATRPGSRWPGPRGQASVGPLALKPRGTGTLRWLQAQLEIGAVDDPLEKEADRVADQVVRMPSGTALPARACAACDADDKLQRETAGPAAQPAIAPPIVHDVLRSAGRPLDAATRGSLEPRFGYDFSAIRVHTNDLAAQAARSVAARAYTVGPHIVFGRNEYAPGTEAGRRLLAHELAHVIQQGHGRDRSLRREADDAASKDNEYWQAVESQDWQAAAEWLNGFNRDDIFSRLAALTVEQVAQIHRGAIGNPRVGPQSQVALLSVASQTSSAEALAPDTTAQPAPATSTPAAGASPPATAKPVDEASLFAYPAAADAVHGITPYYAVQSVPFTDSSPFPLRRAPYLIVPHLRRAGGGAEVVYYVAFRSEPGLVGPTNWNEYVIGPDSLHAFLGNLRGYAGAGAFAYLFGPPSESSVEGSAFVDSLMGGNLKAAGVAYGRALHAAVTDPNWWIQMILAGTSLVDAAAPAVPGPRVPFTPRVIQGGGASAGVATRPAVIGNLALKLEPVPGAVARLEAVPAGVEGVVPAAAPAPAAPGAAPGPNLAGPAAAAAAAVGASPATQPAPARGPEKKRSDDCEARPVGFHRGGDALHDQCSDKIPPNRFPGSDVLVKGKAFDALQVGQDVLWEVKTSNYSKQNKFIRDRIRANILSDAKTESLLAAACGYGYTLLVGSETLADVLRPFLPGVPIDAVPMCEQP